MTRTRVYDGFVKVDIYDSFGRKRHVVVTTDSVGILAYNPHTDEVFLVEQFRAPMRPEDGCLGDGVIQEVPAERVDRETSIIDLVIAGLAEELGIINVTAASVRLLNNGQPVAVSPGILTERQYLAYVEVAEAQILPGQTFGNEEEGELTHRFSRTVDSLATYVLEDLKTFALIQWFLREKGR